MILYHGSKEIAEGLLPSFAPRYTVIFLIFKASANALEQNIYIANREHPKVCVNLQTDVR